MSYVSVGQVENLQEAVISLNSICQSMEEDCRDMNLRLETKMQEAGSEAAESARLLEDACSNEAEKEQELENAKCELERAQSDLADAEYEASCEEQDGQSFSSRNTASEAYAVDCAFEAVSAAEAELDRAREHRMKMEQRHETAQRAKAMIDALVKSVNAEMSARLSRAGAAAEEGISRLNRAQASLEEYIGTNQPAGKFYSWLNYKPDTGRPVYVPEISSRLNMSPEQQRLFTEYLYDRDPQFKAAVNKYRAELSECRGAAEVHYVQNKVIKEFSGSYGEKLVYHALRPLAGNIKTQERTVFPDGSYTKTDIIFEDLKVPMILGKGEGMSAHVGGNIAVEVKIGQPAYIYSQKDHMVFQAGGHKDASASAVICSRDIKKLSEEKENILRSAMREAGSPIIGMLPEKNEIDSACWEIVRNGALKEDENI